MSQPSYSTVSPPPGPTDASEREPLLILSKPAPKNVIISRTVSPSPSTSPSATPAGFLSNLSVPSAARFFADFTLGFADGLTVPFALTAGLSSLGQTDTVIYAGMAEICAGSISMGIGGYLSAKGEYNLENRKDSGQDSPGSSVVVDEELGMPSHDDDDDCEDQTVITEEPEQDQDQDQDQAAVVARYLAPLGLEQDEEMKKLVEGWVRLRPGVVEAIVHAASRGGSDEETRGTRSDQGDEDSSEKSRSEEGTATRGRSAAAPSPFLVGLSVSLGYLLGGLLPLFPYFFVANVGDGLKWSFGVCLFALFGFGFLKDFCLNRGQQASGGGAGGDKKRRVSWRDVRTSAWEGTQMALMGGVAAIAAVLCVKLFEDLGV
ncbi:VIT family-domain-containing protein [Cladorrhinum samala]|uniref:VIT family-domain-containing protein n=1 Tax=Cladorrhinum samala TaxID=585594 RepID=A0AAV9HPU7_9PEZI|nr:VIT family-domain-containing protein [Cladorrhinum samala]